jgi:hypothetical protein
MKKEKVRKTRRSRSVKRTLRNRNRGLIRICALHPARVYSRDNIIVRLVVHHSRIGVRRPCKW